MARLFALAFTASFVVTSGAFAAPFKHIVIVIQENRTIDNLFGSNPTFEPGVDVATYGKNSKGENVALTAAPLAGCYDLDHSHKAFEIALTKGFDQEEVIAHKCTAAN